MTGDDHAYSLVASAIAQGACGVASDGAVAGDLSNVHGPFAYFEAAVYCLLGANVLFPLILNAGFAGAVTLFSFDLARRLFRGQVALVAAILVAFWPSLAVWASLNLKDTLIILLIQLLLWSTARFQFRPRLPSLALAVLALVTLLSFRYYLVATAILAATAGILLALWYTFARLGRAIVAASFALGTISAYFIAIPQMERSLVSLERLEQVRLAMAAGANTSFQDTLYAAAGDTFLVSDASPITPTGAAIHVLPGATLLLAQGAKQGPGEPGEVTYVGRGDLIVVGPSGVKAAPPGQWKVLSLLSAGRPLRVESSDTSVAIRTLSYLPRAIAHVLLAPFPWALRRPLDLATVPEMLAWYLVLGAAGFTLLRRRDLWRLYVPIVVFVLGTVLVLALVEGNVGTLFRHRGMVVPSMIILASPTLVEVAQWIAARMRVVRPPVIRSIPCVVPERSDRTEGGDSCR